MTTLLQLIIPAIICWLIWIAFRPRKRNDGSSASCDSTSGSGCDSTSHGGCNDSSGGSCDGGGNGGGGD